MAWTLPPLTERMAEFATAYITERTVTGACRKIGLAKPHGFRYMRDERVQAAIALGAVPPEAVTDPKSAEIATRKPQRQRAHKARVKRVKRAIEQATEIAQTYEAPAAAAAADLSVYDKTKVLGRLSTIAEASAADLFKLRTGKRKGETKFVLKDIDELPPGLAYAIQRIEITAAGTMKVHLYSKLDALRLLGQATDAFIPGEGEGPVGGEVTEETTTLEARLQRYGNVVAGKFRPKPAT